MAIIIQEMYSILLGSVAGRGASLWRERKRRKEGNEEEKGRNGTTRSKLVITSGSLPDFLISAGKLVPVANKATNELGCL